MSFNSTITLPRAQAKSLNEIKSSHMIFVPLSEKKKPDYAVIVPETGRTYRQDDGRYLGLVGDVFPKVAEQITIALAAHTQSASPNSDNSSEEDAGYEYSWTSKHPPGPRNAVWELAKGQDCWCAIRGQPDAGKFSIVFINTATGKPRIEVYRHIEGFDWDSPACIARLNKSRNQSCERRLGLKRFENHGDDLWTAADWERINFELITAGFNASMGGTRQFSGADLADEECDKPTKGFHQRHYLFKDSDSLICSVEDVMVQAHSTQSSIEASKLGTELFQDADFRAAVLMSCLH